MHGKAIGERIIFSAVLQIACKEYHTLHLSPTG